MRIPPDEFRACVMDHPIIAIKACEKLSQVQGSLLENILNDSNDASPADSPSMTSSGLTNLWCQSCADRLQRS